MIRTRLLVSACLAVASLSFLVAGCGNPGVKVNGTITKKGAPFQLSEKGVFQLTFDDESNPKETFPASPNKDGSFTIQGRGGGGIPYGKYVVVLHAMDPYDKQTDLLKGKYARGKSKLVVEIKSADPIKIDVE